MKKIIQNSTESAAVSRALLLWFKANRRVLPWRNTGNWYHVFLSEFLLQQTQVAQALPYFTKLVHLFPDIVSLAAASEDDLLQNWSGLGYYSRARNLLKAARIIVNDFNGQFPQEFRQALSLPGIGPYTAAAVLSIAFNKPYAVVDGNVMRVISRLFGISHDIRLSTTQKQIRQLAQSLLPPNAPGTFNEALMELGALICLPNAPQCAQCPLKTKCIAFKENRISQIPLKSSPRAKKHLYHFVYLMAWEGHILTVQRPRKGLLAGMWEFPVCNVDAQQLTKVSPSPTPSCFDIERVTPVSALPIFKHLYSHIALQFRPLLVTLSAPITLKSDFYLRQKWLSPHEMFSVALHNAHKKILQHPKFKIWWQKQKSERT